MSSSKRTGRPRTPLGQRLQKFLRRAPNGCLEFVGAKKGKLGYGAIYDAEAGHHVAAHRAAFALAHGPIPVGLLVCHHCDNPPCCDPAHLFLGTAADNFNDMRRKGRERHASGEQSGLCKFSDDAIRHAIASVHQGELQISVCRRLGMSASYLSELLSGARQRAERLAA
jgi:hypothetical protein